MNIPFAIITGLKAEAAILAKQGITSEIIACDGMGPQWAAHAARRQITAGARLLISFGTAGGLAKTLSPGTLILPHHVLEISGSTYDIDPTRQRWVYSLMTEQGIAVVEDNLLGVDSIIATIEEKKQLASAHQAIAVDMESHAVAREANKAQIPFLVVRAIADDVATPLPPGFINSIDEAGSVHLIRLFFNLVKAPHTVPAVLRSGYAFSRSLKTLKRAAYRLANASHKLAQDNLT